MLVLIAPEGRPYATVSDPVPAGYQDFLTGEGMQFLELATEDLPDEVFFKYHLVEGSLQARPTFQVPDTIGLPIGEATVLNLPAGTTVAVDNGEPVLLEDSSLEIEGEMPANYTLRISNWPYLDAQIEVTIHEA